MSVKEYFLLDAAFPDCKYEYHEGVVQLMSGGPAEHATIAGNIYMDLRLQFRSSPFSPLSVVNYFIDLLEHVGLKLK